MSVRRSAAALCLALALAASLAAQPAAETGAASDAAARDAELMARFEQILERNPRRGTAFDRVYGHHAQNGTLEELIERWRGRAEAEPQNATPWMLLGLVESRRGNDTVAAEAFARAEASDEQDSDASFYLAESLRMNGGLREAADAYRRAIQRVPARAELLNIYRLLGRTLQRAGLEDDALGVWKELEQEFPGDLRVAEQIAAALSEEGQYEEARQRYEALAERSGQDLYGQITHQIQAADLTLRLGERDDAVVRFEHILSRLNPDSWLYRQVRSKIEGAFRRVDDLAGLVEYYDGWIERHPDDLDAMTSVAKVLATLGRSDESERWFHRAMELAPSQTAIRQAYIDQLVYNRDYPRAIEQYAALAEVDPNNPDVLQQWGLLLLRDRSLSEAEQRQRAAEIWMRLVEARPNDPVVAVQVADLLRQAEAFDQAEELYRRAAADRPLDVQYHEYVGEFLHSRERPEEAVAAWQKLAAGELETPQNLHRLAEVFRTFGYLEEALGAADQARQAEPREPLYHLTYIDLLLRQEEFDSAKAAIAEATDIATDLEQRERLLDKEIEAHQGAGTMSDVIAALEAELGVAGNGAATAAAASDADPAIVDTWLRLARFLYADRQLDQAISAVETAVERDPASIAAYRMLADYKAAVGSLNDASQAYRRLATIDSQFRSSYLREIARLDVRLGRIDDALAAGRELIASAPGNAEHYHFYADLCFQVGRSEEGLETLRRAVRTDPSEIGHLLRLASALANQFQTDEATELYWQAYEKAEDLREQLSIVSRLAEQHLLQNQFDRLIARLERKGRQDASDRAATFSIAQAHLQAEDFTSAKDKLAAYLAENQQDTLLLEQLARISEQEGDFDSAINYQQQLAELTRSRQERRKLAQLLLRADRPERAETILAELALEQDERHNILTSADELLAYERYDAAAQVIAELARRQPQDWEVLYRQGVAAARRDDPAEAARHFQDLLEISLDHDEKTASAKAAEAMRPHSGPGGRSAAAALQAADRPPPVMSRVSGSQTLLREVGLVPMPQGVRLAQQFRIWTPSDYGTARMAAMAWLIKLSDDHKETIGDMREELVDRFAYATEGDTSDERPAASFSESRLYDAMYFAAIENQYDTLLDIARELSRSGDVAGSMLYLYQLQLYASRTGRTASRGQPLPPAEPLSDDELEHMLACYARISEGGSRYVISFLSILQMELERAGREGEANEIYARALDRVDDATEAAQLLSLVMNRQDLERVPAVMQKARELSDRQPPPAFGSSSSRNSLRTALPVLFAGMAEQEQWEEMLDILVAYLDWAEADRQAAARSFRRSRFRQPPTSSANYVYSYSGGALRGVTLDFPTPTAAFDQVSLTAVRNAFEYLLQNDEIHRLRARLAQEAPSQGVTAQLAEAYVDWWLDDKVAATAKIQEAVAASDADEELSFQLAQAMLAVGDPAGALEVLEAISSPDPGTTVQREMSILSLAMQTGYIDRARLAAERLFGLRLTSEHHLLLAQFMQQLGMHEMSSAVLNRARRQSGAASSDLLSLMNAFQQQGKQEEALQIAHQILRARPTTAQQSSQQEQYRRQALQVIARLGDIDALIADTEARLARASHSLRLMRQLADYYQADGQTDKAQEIVLQMVEFRPDDAQSRFQSAQLLEKAGDRPGAIEHYLAALKLDPALFDQTYSQIQRTFEQENRLDDLAKVFLESDLSKLSQPAYIMNFMQRLIQRGEDKEQALALFEKLWKAHPQYGQSMLLNLDQEEFKKSPIVYQYVREITLDNTSTSPATSWRLVEQIMSWSSNGTIRSAPGMLLDVAQAQDKLDELRTEIEESAEERQDWPAGRALLGMIALRQGRAEEAQALFDALLEERLDEVPAYTCIILGNAMEETPALRPWAAKLYERAMKDTQRFSGLGYEHGPERRLLNLYKLDGRRRAARELLLRVAESPPRSQNNPEYDAYNWLRQQVAIGEDMAELEYPLDALYIINSARNDTQKIRLAQRYGSTMQRQFDQVLEVVNAKLKPEVLLAYLPQAPQDAEADAKVNADDDAADVVSEADTSDSAADANDAEEDAAVANDAASDPADGDAAAADSDGAAADAAADDETAAVDATEAEPFNLLVYTTGENQPKIGSPIADLIAGLEADNETLQELDARLAALAGRQQADLSLRTLWALVQLQRQDSSDGEAVPQLAEFVQASIAPVPDERGALAADQQELARAELGLWLVARRCLAENELARDGEQLADRAMASAGLLNDRNLLAAMLRESGELALGRGDADAAEAHFRTLLDVLLDREPRRPLEDDNSAALGAPSGRPLEVWASPLLTALALQTAASPANDNAAASAAEPVESRRRLKPVTVEVFAQLVDLATLTASNGMHELSLETAREALRGGPPIPAMTGALAMQSIASYSTGMLSLTSTPTAFYSVSGIAPASAAQNDQDAVTVARALIELDDLWRLQGIPSQQVYEVLSLAVLPEGRPNELFLYTAGTEDAAAGAATPQLPTASPRARGSSSSSLPLIRFLQSVVQNTLREVVRASPDGSPASDNGHDGTGHKDTAAQEQPSQADDTIPEGGARRLIRRAIEAEQTDDLGRRVAARAEQPMAAVSARVLLVMLGLATDDQELAGESLAWLSERLTKDRQQRTVQLAVLAAVPAVQDDAHYARGADLMEKIIQAAESQNDSPTAEMARTILDRAAERRRPTEAAAEAAEAAAEESTAGAAEEGTGGQ